MSLPRCVFFLLISSSFILLHLMVVSVPLSSSYLLKISRIQWLINFLDFKIATVWQTMSYYYQHYNINGHFVFWLKRFVVWSCKNTKYKWTKKKTQHSLNNGKHFIQCIYCLRNEYYANFIAVLRWHFLSISWICECNCNLIWFDREVISIQLNLLSINKNTHTYNIRFKHKTPDTNQIYIFD